MRELTSLEIETVSGAGLWEDFCEAMDSAWDSVMEFFGGGGGDPAMACDFLPSGGQICSNGAETIRYKQELDAYTICEATGEGDCVVPTPPNYSK